LFSRGRIGWDKMVGLGYMVGGVGS
jgi:hypothetical protein